MAAEDLPILSNQEGVKTVFNLLSELVTSLKIEFEAFQNAVMPEIFADESHKSQQTRFVGLNSKDQHESADFS